MKRLIFLSLFGPFCAKAGIFEALSEATYYSTNFETCGDINESALRSQLTQEFETCRRLMGEVGLPDNNLAHIAEITAHLEQDVEDQFFSSLGQRAGINLRCSARFANQLSLANQETMDPIVTSLILARQAKQELNAVTQDLATNTSIMAKVCPTTLDQLEREGQPDIPGSNYYHCEAIIKSRVAFNMAKAAVPLSGVDSVKNLIDEFVNLPEESDSHINFEQNLDRRLSIAFRKAAEELDKQGADLFKKSRRNGGEELDRTDRRALMNDSLALQDILENAGNSDDMKNMMCKANARYGEGADTLDGVLLAGTLAIGGAVGVAARLTAGGTRLAMGAMNARRLGHIGTTGLRVLQTSAFATTSLTAYSQIDQACSSLATNRVATGPSGRNNKCSGAPKIEEIPQANCLLTAGLSAIGYGIPAIVNGGRRVGGLASRIRAQEYLQRYAGNFTIMGDRLRAGRIPVGRSSAYEPNAVYIGVANHAREGTHHYYLMAGGRRFDGIPLSRARVTGDQRPLTLRQRISRIMSRQGLPLSRASGPTGRTSSPAPTTRARRPGSETLTDGVVFRIGVPEEVVDDVVRSIDAHRGSMSLSCLHGLCRVLDDTPIELPVNARGVNLRARPTMAGVLDGNVRVGGAQVSPDQIRMFATSERQLETFMRNLQTADAEGIAQLGIYGGSYLIFFDGVVGGLGSYALTGENRSVTSYVIYELFEETSD